MAACGFVIVVVVVVVVVVVDGRLGLFRSSANVDDGTGGISEKVGGNGISLVLLCAGFKRDDTILD